jgi:hypothetical protein
MLLIEARSFHECETAYDRIHSTEASGGFETLVGRVRDTRPDRCGRITDAVGNRRRRII